MDDCDLWEGFRVGAGYGRLYITRVDRRRIYMLAHRLVWQQDNGHTDLHILHSCDTPSCINIEHLRVGTPQDNMDDREKRGSHRNSVKTHCSQGHEFTPENTYTSSIALNGWRTCKTCNRRTALAGYYRRKKLQQTGESNG
jgi:hypothetical protein